MVDRAGCRVRVAATLRRALVAAALLMGAAPGAAWAQTMPSFTLDMRDGVLDPTRIEVPAGTPFKLEITNSGKTPAEFETHDLKREKVLAPGVSSSIVFRRVDPGEYVFFDDFHPQARGILVVK